jgi:transposase
MIVIGADTHKSTHALAAVDAGTGQLLREREIVAKDVGHLEALRWAHELDGEIVWAIEDCRDFSYHLEQALLAAGERVVRVAQKLMGASRRGEREPGKSDRIDARAIARAVLREGSSGSLLRSSTRTRWRFVCSATTARRLSTSAPGSSTGCGSTL